MIIRHIAWPQRKCWIYWAAALASSPSLSSPSSLSSWAAAGFSISSRRKILPFVLSLSSVAATSPLSTVASTITARSMSSTVPSDVQLYHEMVASAVDLSNAHVSDDGILTVTRSVRDLDNSKKRRFLYTMVLPKSDSSSPPTPTILQPPVEYHDHIKLRLPSPSGKKIAIFRQEGDATTKPTNVVEIWNGASLQQRIILSSPDLARHGKVIYDTSGFGQPSWSSTDDGKEEFLLYSAERNPLKTQSFFSTKPLSDATKTSEEGGTADVSQDANINVGGSFTLGIGKLEGWGEKYTKQSPLLDLYLLHTGTGRIGRIENVPGQSGIGATFDDGVTLGQAVLSPTLLHVVYAAWHVASANENNGTEDAVRMSRRFGLIYCQQRPCQLYASPIRQLVQQLSSATDSVGDDKDGTFIALTRGYRIASSPRFGPRTVQIIDGQPSFYYPMVFLSCAQGFDTHSGCFALSAMEWSDDGPKLETLRAVVDQVVHPKDSPADQQVADLRFPGLFLQNLPEPCFERESDGQLPSVVTATQWGSVQRVVRISLDTGKVQLIPCQLDQSSTAPPSESFASQTLLAVTGDGGVVVTESAPNQPATLAFVSPSQVYGRNASGAQVNATQFAPILASSLCSSTLSPVPRGPWGMSYQVLNLVPPPVEDGAETGSGNDETIHPLQCILVRPSLHVGSPQGKTPLIVIVHGGPHSCFPTAFSPTSAFLAAGGYALLIVNYRGSTGFGQAGIDVLPGRCGTLDVQDVVYATNTIVEEHSSWIDRDRLGICGGSHGGFLTGHITGQYPQLFKAAVMRNPVTNIASMVTATDIPDWCYVEALGVNKQPFDWTKFYSPTQEELATMYANSPVAHVRNVVTPTLVALGLSDQRVPPSQGQEWFHTLRSQGVPSKLVVYEDNDHALDGVDSEADHWLNIKRWLDKYLM